MRTSTKEKAIFGSVIALGILFMVFAGWSHTNEIDQCVSGCVRSGMEITEARCEWRCLHDRKRR